MIELTFLALLNRLMNWGLAPLITTRTVAADAAALAHFLSDPAHQRHLVGPHPGLAVTGLRTSSSGRVIALELVRGRHTVLWLTWILSAGRGTTEVDLAVQFETRRVAARLVLVLGGRRWLARRAEAALGRLAQICARAAEEVAPAPLTAASPPAPSPAPSIAAADCHGRVRKTRPARDANPARSRPR